MATTSKHWTTEPDQEVDIKVSLSGAGSLPPITVNEAFQKTCESFSDRPALSVERKDSWITWSFKDYYEDVKKAAKSMIALGLEPHYGVGILGFNSPEWFIIYMGTIMAGGIATGIYTTNSREVCHYIADNCRAQLFFCENAKQLTKIIPNEKEELPMLKKIIQYLPESVEPISEQHRKAGVISWEEFLEIGKDIAEHELKWKIDSQKPGHCASLVYTSGTTGPPKGVMLSHDNLVWTGTVVSNQYRLNENGRFISYLPLSHVAAQMIDILSQSVVGHCVYFAQPDALKGSLKTTLNEVHPTLFFGVPRVWEKFKEAIERQTADVKGIKSFILEKSKDIGRRTVQNRQTGGEPVWGYWFANKLIFSNLREKLGLDQCLMTGVGAAPVPKAVVEFFAEYDIPLYQLFGMSESTATGIINLKERFKPFAAGCPLEGVEVKIDSPGPNKDGEICLRGRNVFMGYLYNEDKTKESIDEEGWLHTGDIGSVDGDNFYYITGRSKEIIITKGGENVAPVPIEELMLKQMKLLSNVMVIGDDQRYLTMFVTIKCKIDDSGNPTEELDPIAKLVLDEIGSKATTVTDARTDEIVINYVQKEMEIVNESSISRATRVQKFRILPCDFSIQGGEFTPTFKVKRKTVLEKYHDYVTQLYSD